MKGQSIRPSLYMFTYGVGAIIETPSGPMVIPSTEKWGGMFGRDDIQQKIEKFEIHDPRASFILNGAQLFRLPTNADFRRDSEYILFKAIPFPRWGLCMKQDHYKLFKIKSHGETGCPDCKKTDDARKQAVRFVMACSRGHMTDIPWASIVHSKNKSCDNQVFSWDELGNSLNQIIIRCPECNSQKTLGEIYGTKFICPGYFPESGANEKCDREARVVLRNASYLRVPEVVSFLTIPPMNTSLHLILGRSSISSVLGLLKRDNHIEPDTIRQSLSYLQENYRSVGEQAILVIEQASDEDLLNAAKDILEIGKSSENLHQSATEELRALKLAAVRGAPPDPTNQTPTLEVEKGKSKCFPLSKNLQLRITPVKRLRVVSVQLGYRRLIREPEKLPELVDTHYFDDKKWYVALEMFGEGIFIDFPDKYHLNLHDSVTAKNWMNSWLNCNESIEKQKYHPEFVWWHTLSHRIISSLGIDSGYSSSSIRERVYYDHNKRAGGILLYVSQKGADGTMGGMIALVPKFKRVLDSAITNLEFCSNDPLCRERIHEQGSKLGAACYGCLLVSETSCEHRNLFLDRNLLVESLW